MRKQTHIPIHERSASSFIAEATRARHWDLSCRTLQRWRKLRQGPPFSLIKGSVRYRIQDILDFENCQRRGGEDWT